MSRAIVLSMREINFLKFGGAGFQCVNDQVQLQDPCLTYKNQDDPLYETLTYKHQDALHTADPLCVEELQAQKEKPKEQDFLGALKKLGFTTHVQGLPSGEQLLTVEEFMGVKKEREIEYVYER